jgi:predicted phosphodiesterase
VLLHAGTHRPTVETFAGRLAVNPGSATLPDDHAPAAFARITFTADGPDAEIVAV